MPTIDLLSINITYVTLTISGILGLIIGSFLNMVIYRLPIMLKTEYEKSCFEYWRHTLAITPQEITLAAPRSHCPNCKATISWWQNIPLISYILLRGKCHNCQILIPWRYPIVEILSCIATVWVVAHCGINIKTSLMLILTWILIAAIFIDLEHQLLPDNLTFPLLWLGLLANTNTIFTTPTDAIIGATCGYILLWTINKVFKIIRKVDGMGYGDFKLLAAFGAWLGWQLLPLILFTASLAGAVVGIYLIINNQHLLNQKLSFGPFLAVAGWLAFFWGRPILHWYITV